MHFTLDLASRPFIDRRLVNMVSAALGIILTVLLAGNGVRCITNLGEMRSIENDSAALQKRGKGPALQVSEAERASMRTEIHFFNDIIRRRAFDWMDLLQQVENTTPKGIWLSSLFPDRKTGMIKVEGLAGSFGNVRAYLEQLEASGIFTDVLLVSHENTSLWEKANGVRFTVSFRMRTS